MDDRPDKWVDTKAAFDGTGIKIQRFSGIRHKEGWRGCGAAHVAIAREAMRRGLPWVLVIEDDCLPVADFTERWPIVKKALWNEMGSWDIFLGGPTYIQGPIEHKGKDLISIDTAFATHFYVLQAAAYERVIAWNPDRHGPIDLYYSNQLRKVTTYPMLATQRASLSDIKGTIIDYSKFFDESDDSMQQLMYAYRTRGGTVALLVVSLLAIWLISSRR